MRSGCRCFTQFFGISITFCACLCLALALSTPWWYRTQANVEVGIFTLNCNEYLEGLEKADCHHGIERLKDHPFWMLMLATLGTATLCSFLSSVAGLFIVTCACHKAFPITGLMNLIGTALAISGVVYFAYLFAEDGITNTFQEIGDYIDNNSGFGYSFLIAIGASCLLLIAGIINLSVACCRV
ncbi:unnamed protein product [Bursaphelenchus xylophilus]|uniref:(pine wood nematode) hypothetical protein n=1 Tax=Bursaphelenchus xylophilus TaxID=6326 RepID=A0A1I7SDM7_BURXY|nr:unnamed protein product [Bursaphelenchus xylophilus]CAG9120890.1 unnamed protein product [Bursaphelenchus xylophilus]